MKKVFKVLPLISLGGNFKLSKNSQIIIQRMKQDEILIQNMDSNFKFKLDPQANKLTIEVDNFKLGDALILFDDAGISDKRVINGDAD
jgi:hypothetical protein